MVYRFIDKTPCWRLAICALLAVVCGIEATYNGRVVTRQYAVDNEPQLTTHTETILRKVEAPVNVTTVTHHYSYGSGGSHGSSNNDNEYQQTETYQSHGSTQPSYSHSSYGHSDVNRNSYQKQQHEGEYYQQQQNGQQGQQQHYNSNGYQQQHHYQQSQHQPQSQYNSNYEATHSSQNAGNWQHSDNSITDYYTGCPSGHTGQLPYAYDCRRFLNCWKGRGHIQSCSVGTVFNPETLECDRPDKVRCGANLAVGGVQTSTHTSTHGQLQQKGQHDYRAGRFTDATSGDVDILCPTNAQGLQPHPSDCTKFINCANGNVHIQDCGPGTAFDANMKVCDFKDKVDCAGRGGTAGTGVRHSKSQITCPPDVSGLYAHPYDCTKFLQCANGQTYIQDCGPGTAFDSVKLLCDFKDKVKCASGSTTTSGNSYEEHGATTGQHSLHSQKVVCPSGAAGLYPHPYECTKFLQCANGQTFIQDCGPGTAFNSESKVCDFKDKVQCGERNGENGQHAYGEHGVYHSGHSGSSYGENGIYYSGQSGNSYGQHGGSSHSGNSEHSYGQHGVSYTGKVECPQGASGLHPHPFNCTKYLQCSNGQTFVQDCGPGTAFNSATKVCDFKDKVKCGSANGQHGYGEHGGYNSGHSEGSYGEHGGYYSGHSEGSYGEHGTHYSGQSENSYGQHGGSSHSGKSDNSYGQHGVSYTGKIECPQGASGLHPHPYNCTKFLQCNNGQTFVQDCGPGTAFNTVTKVCDFKEKVNCSGRNSTKFENGQHYYGEHGVYYSGNSGNFGNSLEQHGGYNSGSSQNSYGQHGVGYTGKIECPQGASGLHPHPFNCTKFLQCSNGQTFVQDCGPGTAFNTVTKVCDFKHKVNCASSGSSGSSTSIYAYGQNGVVTGSSVNSRNVKCAHGASGLHAHPYDCEKFMQCSNGETFIQNCGPGTGFDSVRLVCDFKDKVHCGVGAVWHSTAGGSSGSTGSVHTQHTSTSTTSSHGAPNDLPHNADILCLNGITGIFPYPFDYTKFINCKNGNTAIQNCVHGTAFSISKGYCEALEQIEKSDHVMYIVSEVSYEYSQTLITCPPGTEGIHLYPFNAERFVKCVHSQMEVVACPSAQVFSTTRRLCLPSNQVLKSERVRLLSELQKSNAYRFTDEFFDAHTMVYCPLGLTGTYPHPFDNSKYIRCGGGRMLRESCASGKAYSLSRKECGMKEDIGSSDRVAQTQINYHGDWHISDIETTFGSIDGLTYLMCPPGLSGYFLHPFDCTKYLQCENGVTKIDACTTGSVFSISRKECIPRDGVEAYDRVEYLVTTQHELSNEFALNADHDLGVSCSPGTFGVYAHPHSYRMYVRCSNGRISVEHCVPGEAFSIHRGMCFNEHEVSNNDRSSYTKSHENGQGSQTEYTSGHQTQTYYGGQGGSTATTTSNGYNAEAFVPEHKELNCPAANSNGRFAHPYDCTKFIMCSNGEAHIQSCGPGTAWSREMEVCDFKDKVDCGHIGAVSSTQQLEILCPHGYEGLYEHPYDWRKYLSCTNGRTYIMDCGVGTVFSVTRKTCDLEVKVDNTDRCNKGVIYHGYDYSYTQNSNGNPNIYGTVQNQWSYNQTHRQPTTTTTTTTYTQTQPNSNDRWTNMNMPRPQGSTYNQQTGTWQHATVTHQQQPSGGWVATTDGDDQQRPIGTVVYESGSWHPDSNYNRHNTPLAPLAPLTPASPATSTSTIVYAQPVGSQEDSQEAFNTHHYPYPHIQPNPHHIPTTPSSTNRQNFTRNIVYTPLSNIWIPMGPNTQLVPGAPALQPINPLSPPATPGQPIYIDNRPHYPSVPNVVPQPVNPIVPVGPPFTEVYFPNGPQYPSGSLGPLEQGSPTLVHYPAGSYVPLPPNHMLPPLNSNDDRGQRPLTDTKRTSTTINVDHLPGTFIINEPDTEHSESRKVHIVDNSNRNFPAPQPLPRTTQRSVVKVYEHTTQIPQPSQATTPIHLIPDYPKLSNATIQTFPNQPHYSHGYSEVTHSRNTTTSNTGRKIPQHVSIKPTNQSPSTRLEKSKRPNSNNEEPQEQLTSNAPGEDFTNLDLNDPQNLPLKEALQLMLRPYLNQSGTVDEDLAAKAESHIMSLVTPANKGHDSISTTTHKPLNTTPISRLLGGSVTTPHDDDDVELILAGEQHHLGNHETTVTTSHTYHNPSTTAESERSTVHNHNTNWHKHHQYNPSSSKVHSREYHEKHPNLPNPFKEEHNVYDIDIRSGDADCPFNCGNGRCILRHEVCNGVNNCGNRKDEQQCDHLGYEVRLTGGESSNMGRVEVKILGKWGYVCDDKFGLKDADVLCRELGFKMGAMEVRGSSYYPPSDMNAPFNMDEIECKGNETSLRECDFKGWGVNNCGPDEVVGVVCKVQKMKCPDNYWLCAKSEECIPTAFVCDLTPDCSDGSDESSQVCNAPIQYRLEGGRNNNEGRLEVLYRGEWGTVCDDDFGVKEAQVVCNALGLYGKPEVAKNIYGPGRGPIWLDQVSCMGNETCLDKCNHFTWGENNCQHTEDVGLKCTAGPKLAPTYIPTYTDSDADLSQQVLEYEQSEMDDLGKYQGLWQRSSKAVDQQKQCGHFKSNLIDEYAHPEERVINGSIAKRGRHPWQATIRTRGRGGISSHWCGAVIISKKLVLTAAHCLAGYPKGSYFVRMGDHYANIAESSEIDSNIENWYIHEKFRDQKHMNNDIALILLKNPVRFNDYIQPICLPEKGAELEANRICTISGWGSIKSGTSTPSNILRAAEVPILSDDVCSRKDVYANAMSEGMFCAGFLDENADACDGDSGGPLVCHDNDAETLYGIISWGQHCGYRNHPGVYVRVEKYIDWIYEKINLMIQQGKL